MYSILFNYILQYSQSISLIINISVGSGKKKLFTCSKHVNLQIIYNKVSKQRGCKICCNNSKLEFNCFHILNNLNILSISQKSFENCRYKQLLKFDFYLPEYNILIELDGYQHFNIVRRSNKLTDDDLIKQLSIIKIRDNIKTEYAKNNNIRLLRISYSETNNMKDHIINFINSIELFKFHGIEYENQSNGISYGVE